MVVDSDSVVEAVAEEEILADVVGVVVVVVEAFSD